MLQSDVKIGMQVVKAKGDNVTLLGEVIEIDAVRVRVKWEHAIRTWVKADHIEDISIPHYFTELYVCKKTGRITRPKYIRK